MRFPVVRTQIQLTEAQADSLKTLASRSRVSMAEVIRRAVDAYLVLPGQSRDPSRTRRALEAVGQFASQRDDVSGDHDTHLAEAWKP